MRTILLMRRLIILLLLCLLPLQTSWAMVADYCGYEQNKAVQHFGHHDDEHHKASPSTLADSTAPEQGNSSLDHDHCHLSSFLGALSEYTFSMRAPLQLSLHRDDQSYAFLAADKPARPNWFVTA